MTEKEQLIEELKNVNYVIDSLGYKIKTQKTKKRFLQEEILKLEELEDGNCNLFSN